MELNRRTFLKIIPAAFLSANTFRVYGEHKMAKPNIVVIMADDMGYSDLGCYGGEISTPNIDRLAAEGLRFRNFYTAARCCPTRASLLTGQYSHKVGMGWMTGADLGTESYSGELSDDCVTVADALKGCGYKTYMCGKWHVTRDDNIHPGGDKSSWPIQRGFDHFYGHLSGSGSYYDPRDLVRDNDFIAPDGEFYMTENVTEQANSYLLDHFKQAGESPFFMYLAYYAPHRPLQVSEKYYEKYVGKYLKGWDVLREERFERQKKLGLIDVDAELSPKSLSPRNGIEIPDWDKIPEVERVLWDKRMAVYAGQIECMDNGIGQILDTLNSAGELDNTLIMFLSDNGGCAEITGQGTPEIIGSPLSDESYRANWANVSNTPYRFYKQNIYEGGIIAPFIVRWPGKTAGRGGYCDEVGHVIDILPTCVDAAGGRLKPADAGKIDGMSLLPVFKGGKIEKRPLYWEHEANRGVRAGSWKLVSNSVTDEPYIMPWELYNLEEDPTEIYDLADKYNNKKMQLVGMWNKWANDNEVFPLDGSDWNSRVKKSVR
ncbi:MAG: arylsulfatase [Sedimentisphaeraceae bacterium JB056]